MKTLMTMFLLIFSIVALAQEVEVNEKIKINDGYQKGTMVYNGTKFVQHGIWKSDHAKARYDMGKLVWIHPNGNRRFTSTDLTILRLKNKVDALENAIASNTK